MSSRVVVFSLAWMVIMLAQAVPASPEVKSNATIADADLIQPAELAASLRSRSTPTPLILQVGSHVLFAEAHIPGSEYVGPGGQTGGLKALRARVSSVPRGAYIVIYCGCCPWTRCPNIAAAYEQLRSLGFTHVKVLYLADNFGTNWVEQGYPASGDQPQAAQFSRIDLAGKPVDLADYQGKVVLLNFWATWCAPCLAELPRFSGWQKKYGILGLQILGISMDDDSYQVKRAVDRYRVPYPVIMGDKRLAQLYGGVFGLPLSYVIDPSGRIITRYEGEPDLDHLELQIRTLLTGRSRVSPQ